VSFDTRVQLLQSLTNDQASLEQAISRVSANGSTSLYNAIYIALKDLERLKRITPDEVRRRAIVVLSDGDDTASSLTFEDVQDLARRSHTSIYTIAIQTPGLPQHDAAFVMRHLAQDTGGMAFFPQQTRDLSRIYREVADELASQYLVAYTSTNPARDGKWRNVTVRVARPDTIARTRSGYFAPAE